MYHEGLLRIFSGLPGFRTQERHQFNTPYLERITYHLKSTINKKLTDKITVNVSINHSLSNNRAVLEVSRCHRQETFALGDWMNLLSSYRLQCQAPKIIWLGAFGLLVIFLGPQSITFLHPFVLRRIVIKIIQDYMYQILNNYISAFLSEHNIGHVLIWNKQH